MDNLSQLENLTENDNSSTHIQEEQSKNDLKDVEQIMNNKCSPKVQTSTEEQQKNELKDVEQIMISSCSPKVQTSQGSPYKIGICGGHSSGKAFLTETLMSELKKEGFKVCVVKQDNFEVDSDDFEHYSKNEENEKGVPFVNNRDYQKFLQTTMNALDNLVNVDVIIIEGTLILYDKLLRDKLDLKVFLQNDDDIRLSRKIFKEVCKRGKDVEQTVQNYLCRLKPLYESIIKPTEIFADLILPKFGGDFTMKTSGTSVSQAGFDRINPNIVMLLIRIVRSQYSKQIPTLTLDKQQSSEQKQTSSDQKSQSSDQKQQVK